jgi:hypothetical protein
MSKFCVSEKHPNGYTLAFADIYYALARRSCKGFFYDSVIEQLTNGHFSRLMDGVNTHLVSLFLISRFDLLSVKFSFSSSFASQYTDECKAGRPLCYCGLLWSPLYISLK